MQQEFTATNPQSGVRNSLDKRIAYHQAGQAAAIYLGNKHKQLPAVYFQIIIKQQDQDDDQLDLFTRRQGRCTATIEGGRLIQTLPLSFPEPTQDFPGHEQEEFARAFEADVTNLLVGPLAEAKHLLAYDDEVFSPNLINLNALQFYDGSPHLAVITEYMECFVADKAEREQKLTELFLAAFSFVNKKSNWHAISALAEFIQNEPKPVISCEEVITLLEARLAA